MLLLLSTLGCGSIGIGDDFDRAGLNPSPGGGGPAAAGGSDTQSSGGSIHTGGSVATGGEPLGTGGAALASGGAIVSGGGGADAVGGAPDPSGGANTGGVGSDSNGGSIGGAGIGGASSGGMDGGGGTGGTVVPGAPSCENPGPNHTPFSTALSLGTSAAQGVWALDTDYTENSGTLAWTAQHGHLALGALELKVVVPFGGGRQVLFPKTLPPDSDVRGAHFFVHVFIASGEEAKALLFAMSSNYAWMNGVPVDMPVGEWVCLELDVDNPSLSDWDFNPRDVITVGVQIDRSLDSPRTDAITAYLDDFSF